jgi:hypothetical protein
MSAIRISPDAVVIGDAVYPVETFYVVRPDAPRLPSSAVMLRYEPAGPYVVSDGHTQREAPPEMLPALDALLADEAAIAADMAAYRPPIPRTMLYRQAGAARRDRQFRKALRADPLEALVHRAKEYEP